MISRAGRLSIGVPGLDEVLHSGLVPDRSYPVRGEPGAGKTVLGFRYLSAGVEADETGLFINLEETPELTQQHREFDRP